MARRLRSRDTREPGLADAAHLAHAQAQSRLTGELDRGVTQTHIARYRKSPPGFSEPGGIQAVLLQQRRGVVVKAAHRVRQILHEAGGQIPQTRR